MPDFALAKARLAVRSAAAPPASVDLSRFAPAVMDQGQTGSCEGHSTAGAIFTTLAAQGKPLPWVPSPAGIYTLARCIDRGASLDAPLQDVGTETPSVIHAIAEYGIRPIGELQFGRYSDVSEAPALLNAEPQLDELEADAKTLAIGAYRITSAGSARETDVKLALAAGFAVRIDSFVDTAFENWSAGDAPFGVPNESDPNGGGHALYILGYTPDYYIVRNSWGQSWGNQGNIQVSHAFVQQADVYAWHISLQEAA